MYCERVKGERKKGREGEEEGEGGWEGERERESEGGREGEREGQGGRGGKEKGGREGGREDGREGEQHTLNKEGMYCAIAPVRGKIALAHLPNICLQPSVWRYMYFNDGFVYLHIHNVHVQHNHVFL